MAYLLIIVQKWYIAILYLVLCTQILNVLLSSIPCVSCHSMMCSDFGVTSDSLYKVHAAHRQNLEHPKRNYHLIDYAIPVHTRFKMCVYVCVYIKFLYITFLVHH